MDAVLALSLPKNDVNRRIRCETMDRLHDTIIFHEEGIIMVVGGKTIGGIEVMIDTIVMIDSMIAEMVMVAMDVVDVIEVRVVAHHHEEDAHALGLVRELRHDEVEVGNVHHAVTVVLAEVELEVVVWKNDLDLVAIKVVAVVEVQVKIVEVLLHLDVEENHVVVIVLQVDLLVAV